jgi:hypothetical protein
MAPKSSPGGPEAETIALKALAFLAGDEDRLERFMALTGLSPEAIRAGAGTAPFLAGVLDYLRGDESLLLVFAESAGVAPRDIATAAAALSGA